MIVALAALVIALGGTAVAASRYLITSTSQIKPSVLRELHSGTADVAKAVPKGPKAVIDRIGLASPVLTTSTAPTETTLTNAVWTQLAGQLNLITGQFTFTAPEAKCNGEIELTLDGSTRPIAFGYLEPAPGTSTYQWAWEAPDPAGVALADSTWLTVAPVNVTHTISGQARDTCSDGEHFKIDSIEIDVLGFR
jgi:hypothetical protein